MEKYLYGEKYIIVKEDTEKYYIERNTSVVGFPKVFFTDTVTATNTLQKNVLSGYNVEGISYRVCDLYEKYLGIDDTECLDLNPSYQRGIAWSTEERQNFIISLFNGTYSGVLTFIMNWKGEYGYELLDGKQRLTAVFDFIEGKYPLANGLYFKDLCGSDQRFLIMYSLDCKRVSSFGENDLSTTKKVELFLYLNSGVAVDKSHLDALRNKYIKECK